MRILVTGSSGFIGSALTRALACRGYHVRAASRTRTAGIDADLTEWVRLSDLAGSTQWSSLLEDVQVVIHLAAIAHRNDADTAAYDQINYRTTAELAEACAARGLKRLIFMSSIGAQAGSAANHVVTECSEAKPVTAYDRAKLAAERAVARSGAAFTILRPVVVYGPGAKANVSTLLQIAGLRTPLPFGLFANKRSLLSIENLIDAVMFCIKDPRTQNRTFIVADPEPISVRQMISTLREAAGKSPNVFPFPPSLIKLVLTLMGRKPLWDRIGRDLVAYPRALQNLGWQPPVTTTEGLRALVQRSVAGQELPK